MIKENTKFIIATNSAENDSDTKEIESSIISPIEEITGSSYELLFRPTEALMAYSTYKSAADGKIPIIIPVGGDGTMNWHLNNSDIYPPGTIYLPLASGTANDIATTVHGGTANISKILQKGRLRQARPLRIKNESIKKNALGYIGLGITGQCAKEINGRENTKPSIIKDSAVSMKGIIKSRTIRIKNNKDSQLSSKHSEIAAVNTRMASFLWPKNPSIFDDHFQLLSPKGYIHTASLAVSGLKKKMEGRKINLGQSVEFEIENNSIRRPIYGQCDGEEFILQNGLVVINKTNKPVNIIALT